VYDDQTQGSGAVFFLLYYLSSILAKKKHVTKENAVKGLILEFQIPKNMPKKLPILRTKISYIYISKGYFKK
jgi:hypothetical protein